MSWTRRWRIGDSNSRSPRRRDNRRDLPQLSAAAAFSAPEGAPQQRFDRERDREFESPFLRHGVCLTGASHGYRRKGPAFAGSVSLDETRERDVLATSRLALAAFL